jgi:hypothetical protein
MILSAPAWPFPAGMPAGSVLPLGVRQEFDRAGMSPAPAGVQIMATSPIVCQGATTYANVTYYTAPSGAGVFAAGTLGWVCQLYGANSCAYGGTTAPISRAVITLTTMNLLTAMTAGPLGRSHPSVATGVETEQKTTPPPPDTVAANTVGTLSGDATATAGMWIPAAPATGSCRPTAFTPVSLSHGFACAWDPAARRIDDGSVAGGGSSDVRTGAGGTDDQ